MSENRSEIYAKASHILLNTDDGDDLSPTELWVVQEAVNGHLNSAGMEKFEDLHKAVQNGDFVSYSKRPFHGIEHLTKDNKGYVYWKGVEVENFDYGQKDGWQEREKAAAEELARKCRLAEEHGIKPTLTSIIWEWEKTLAVINEKKVKEE